MVKLIRLTTTDQKGYFDNTFNEDIILEPNSKIALQSLTTQVNTESIVIDAANNLIEFGGPSNDVKKIHMKEGTYDKTNISDFFIDLTKKFNSSMSATQTQTGKQWEVGTQNSHMAFEIRAGDYVRPDMTAYAPYVGTINVEKVTVSSSVIAYKRDGGTVDTDSFMYFKAPNCKGSSTFRARIYSNQITTQGGFIMGYLPYCPNTSTGAIDKADMLYGLRLTTNANNTGFVYNKIVDGVETTLTSKIPHITTPGSNNNDYINIETVNNQVVVSRFWDGLTEVLFTESYDHITNLFPVIVFVNPATLLDKIAFTTDPFYNDTSIKPIESSDYDSLSIPPIKPGQTSTYYIYIDNLGILNQFGFKTQRIPRDGTMTFNPTQPLVFRAENYFRIKDISDAYLVELQNIKLDSYDSIKQQRMNLLHVIPQYDIVQERIVYTSQYPIFLSLNNAYKINLRQIKARILKEDLSEISTVGYSQITILIDN